MTLTESYLLYMDKLSSYWSKLQRFPYMGGVSSIGDLVQVLTLFLFFSHLFRVIFSDNLWPYQGVFDPLK